MRLGRQRTSSLGTHSHSTQQEMRPSPTAVRAACQPREESSFGGSIQTDDIELQHWEMMWKHWQLYIQPYEADRSAYRSSKYSRPAVIEVQRTLWMKLKKRGLGRAVDGFLILGFVPVDEKELMNDGLPTLHFRQLDTIRTNLHVSFEEPLTVGEDEAQEPAEVYDRVKALEYEVKTLTRQLRLLKSRDAAFDTLSPAPPIPAIVSTKPLVVPTAGNTPVCMRVNYLDPDALPFVVGFAGLNSRTLLPCTVVDHRFIVFVAPPHPRGSVAVTILSTAPTGHLRRYTKAVWIEYKDTHSMNTLSYHAVNQLMSEVPLPSSTTVADTSENDPVNMESCVDEADGVDESHTEPTEQDISSPIDDHMPLTAEMLSMLQAGPLAAKAKRSETAESEASEQQQGSETPASSLRRLAVCTWSHVSASAPSVVESEKVEET